MPIRWQINLLWMKMPCFAALNTLPYSANCTALSLFQVELWLFSFPHHPSLLYTRDTSLGTRHTNVLPNSYTIVGARGKYLCVCISKAWSNKSKLKRHHDTKSGNVRQSSHNNNEWELCNCALRINKRQVFQLHTAPAAADVTSSSFYQLGKMNRPRFRHVRRHLSLSTSFVVTRLIRWEMMH